MIFGFIICNDYIMFHQQNRVCVWYLDRQLDWFRFFFLNIFEIKKKTVLLYNSCAIQFPIWSTQFNVPFILMGLCDHHYNVILEYFSPLPKETFPYWQSLTTSPVSFPSSRQPLVYFLSLYFFPILEILYKWNHILCGLLWLSFGIIFSKFIHDIACIITLFFSFPKVFHWMDILTLYLSI